jgi:mannose-6-phosphate isomerase-like protein (cupin superfamily)
MDGFWFVLRGAARFYTSNDDVLAELGPDEGILIPRDFPYWFESVGDAQLELLQVEAYAKPLRTMTEIAADRVDHAPVTAAQEAYRRTALSKRDAVAEEL